MLTHFIMNVISNFIVICCILMKRENYLIAWGPISVRSQTFFLSCRSKFKRCVCTCIFYMLHKMFY